MKVLLATFSDNSSFFNRWIQDKTRYHWVWRSILH